jgi:RNAse (barnase) inhibitor barstar
MGPQKVKDAGAFDDPAKAGVYRMPADVQLPRPTRGAGTLALWRVDLEGVRNKVEFLATMAQVLDFPDWFGHTWDALKDCLTDLTWRKARGYIIVLERCNGFAQAAREDFETALELFRLVADDWRESHVPFWVLVGGAAAQEFSLPDLVQE